MRVLTVEAREKMSVASRGNQHGLKHGYSGANPTYRSWSGMKTRCGNPANINYKNYGRRGITVCERWQDFISFLADVGERPVGMTLDRIDVNGNYEPDNVRWSTRSEQQRNKRRYHQCPTCTCFGGAGER